MPHYTAHLNSGGALHIYKCWTTISFRNIANSVGGAFLMDGLDLRRYNSVPYGMLYIHEHLRDLIIKNGITGLVFRETDVNTE